MSSETDMLLEEDSFSSPGGRLMKAREALGISQKSIADDLYLPRNYIVWIEEGAYEKLPSMVFCRGYIRAYAKVVGENGEELVAVLDSIYGNTNIKAPLTPVSKIDEQVKVGDPVMKWSTILFAIVLCGVVFWWWETQYGLAIPFQSKQEPIAVETVNGNELVLSSLDENSDLVSTTVNSNDNPQVVLEQTAAISDVQTLQNAGQTSSESSFVDASNVSNTVNGGDGIELSLNIQDEKVQLSELEKMVKTIEPTAADIQNVESSQPELPPEPVVTDAKLLSINFNNECWVTIKDVRGKTLFNGIKKSGEQIALSGDTPLKVSIGRVSSVSRITFNGESIDLAPLSRNNIANFNLPL